MIPVSLPAFGLTDQAVQYHWILIFPRFKSYACSAELLHMWVLPVCQLTITSTMLVLDSTGRYHSRKNVHAPRIIQHGDVLTAVQVPAQ